MGISGSVYNWAYGWLFWLFFDCESSGWLNEAHWLVVPLSPGFCSVIHFANRPSFLLLLTRFFFLSHPLFALPDGIPECSSLRVPKIYTIFGVVGMLRLLAGKQCLEILIMSCWLILLMEVIKYSFSFDKLLLFR